MGLRLGLRSSWHEPAAAGQGELGETIRAYTPDDDVLPVRRGMAREFILMVVVALVIAGTVALLWPPAATPELATGSTAAPAAPARGEKACAEQTWPYLDKECLTRKP